LSLSIRRVHQRSVSVMRQPILPKFVGLLWALMSVFPNI
jgi:hypothetical protein